MKYAYTAIFLPEESGLYSVNFPDLQGCYTTGDDVPDAIDMAQDALCLKLYWLEKNGEPIPEASKPQDIKTSGDQFSSIITADTDLYRRFYEKKSIKKTLTIPMWLNERAEQENVNFSGVLQAALKELLHVQE